MMENRIQLQMKALKLKQADLVRATGAAKSTVHSWLNGATLPNGRYLVLLSELLEVSPEWLLTGRGPTSLKEQAQPTTSVSFAIDDSESNRISISSDVFQASRVRPEDVKVYRVPSSYMEPLIPEGTPVAVDTSQKQIRDRDIFAVKVCGNLHIKMLQRMSDGKLILKNFNTDFPDEAFSQDQAKEIDVLGRVFWWTVLR
ncbi:MAG: helix-turn-helix domain-containing protein [Idiomarina sp.]|nr:helix-turn-helix domain-containing protein [Idiomarina sp.]